MSTFSPRPAQQRILAYQGGKMGVSAVPGSGKTWTLSYLAAQLIRHGNLTDDQEVLIVTLVNSAVQNFSSRVGRFIEDLQLIPGMGYRVRTLHGLARDILSERPDLVNLSTDFEIVDENTTNAILRDVSRTWLKLNSGVMDSYLGENINESKRTNLYQKPLPELVVEMGRAFIKQAKDQRFSPELIEKQLNTLPMPLPLAHMGYELYRDYQRALAYRSGVDFDDLIRLAVEALERDPTLLDTLQDRFPYILEDEAQDSSRLQEVILRMLSSRNGNWVRVGDPNQAIFETFTTANPRYLIEFLGEPDVRPETLPNSGRSTLSVISLANRLITWTQTEHPVEGLRHALTPPLIELVPSGDPQENPPDEESFIYFGQEAFSTKGEESAIVQSLLKWLPENPDKTAAVLVPRNSRGSAVVDVLEKAGLNPINQLGITQETRKTAGSLLLIMRSLSMTGSAPRLARAFEVWRREDREHPENKARLDQCLRIIRKIERVEQYLYPVPGDDWLALNVSEIDDDEIVELLQRFRQVMRRWQGAARLPVDQLVLTLAQDIFDRPAELALAHNLALLLKKSSRDNQTWRLPELSGELDLIAKNNRRYPGFSDDDLRFDPDDPANRGRVVVITMHKAKGMEWDRVYLMSLSNYDFPSDQAGDSFYAEKWFIRDNLDMVAETLAQLETVMSHDESTWYSESQATTKSRLDYSAERLRLLYVGITRARRELILTWNYGRRTGDNHAALPFDSLRAFWETELKGSRHE